MDPRVYQRMRDVEHSHWWFRGRRAVIGAVLRGVPKLGQARVLDAGCGSGGNLSAYTAYGSVVGVDTEQAALGHAARRGYTAGGVASLAALPFHNGTFHLVCATDVIEHVEDDISALRELWRVTAPGGHLLVTVPAHRWLWSEGDVQLGHRRRYTAATVNERSQAGRLDADSDQLLQYHPAPGHRHRAVVPPKAGPRLRRH